MEKTLEQQPSDCLKIVLFGPESTGKSTLAKQLAGHYKTAWVPEYMRGYLQKKWDQRKEIVTKDDLLPIAHGQITSENKATESANGLLFCDTDLLELKVYAEYYYNGFCPFEIEQAINMNRYNMYLLTNIDIPWEDDDLRDRPNDRLTLFRIFEEELKKRKLPYCVISGSEILRLQHAIALIDKLRRR